MKEEVIEPRPLGNIEGIRICIATIFAAVLVTKKKLSRLWILFHTRQLIKE